MVLSPKDFRYLAQGAQAIVTAGAIVVGAALAWYALHAFRRSQRAKAETQEQ